MRNERSRWWFHEKSRESGKLHIVFRITLIYVLVSSLWILFSDWLLRSLAADVNAYSTMQTYKGWLFVAFTGGLLFTVLRHYVSQLQRAEMDLRDSYEALSAIVHASPLAICAIDLEGRVYGWNRAAQQMFGWMEDEVIGSILPTVPDSEQLAFQKLLCQTQQGETFTDLEVRCKTKDATLIDISLSMSPVYNAQGSVVGTTAVLSDITERKRQEHQIQYMAIHDPLTGLLNRRAFEERLDHIIAQSQRGHEAVIGILDVDNFKLINETIGPEEADRFLVALAKLIKSVLPPGTAALGRWSADEFGVLFENTSIKDAHTAGEEIRRRIAAFRFEVNGNIVPLTVSMGMASVTGEYDHQTLLAVVNAALHAAKAQGKNRIVLHDAKNDAMMEVAAAGDWLTWIQDPYQANRFVLHFQPVVNLGTGESECVEGLLRMQAEDGTLVSPGEFLPLAERFGLLPTLDRWVVEQILDKLGQHSDLNVFVNLSATSLNDYSLLEYVHDRLQDDPDVASHLIFEVTETAAISDRDQVYYWVQRLRELGCSFAIDDFGTGFSTFSYLRKMPVDFVKIDGSFIRNLDTDPTNQALVEAMTRVSHSLGKKVIAEWVESESVAQRLKELGVEYGQGYYYGRPAA